MNIFKLPFISLRQVFKSTLWNKIHQKITKKLHQLSASITDIDTYENKFLQIFHISIKEHVFLAKPSLYFKQWWCKNLTVLYKKYINLKNCFHLVGRWNSCGNMISTIDAQA